ncbi:MAG: type II toxin-antitoxin system HicA family toxin [Enterococcus faecalis]|nr:type II toxin-antitoxin system HicA family toxin [Enterococcus faecalis]
MPLTGKQMLKLLKNNGWIERRQEGSHHHLYKDGVRITVPVHGLILLFFIQKRVEDTLLNFQMFKERIQV